MKRIFGLSAGLLAWCALTCSAQTANSGLQVAYGNNGIQQLRYNGVVLEDLGGNESDKFHIWHMKLTDLEGNLLKGGQFDWGEANNGKSWNPSTYTWTYWFNGGPFPCNLTSRATHST